MATTTSTNTNGPYVKYVSASVYEAVRAVKSSHKAFLSWSRTQPHVRSGILRQIAALLRENAQELVQLQVAETNCPELWGRINVLWAALHLEEMSGRITSAGRITRGSDAGGRLAWCSSVLLGRFYLFRRRYTPKKETYNGCNALIGLKCRWNASVFLAIRAIDTPLAVGCTVVLKASEQSPHTHHRLAEIFATQASLPVCLTSSKPDEKMPQRLLRPSSHTARSARLNSLDPPV